MKNRLLERIADIKELQDTAALYKNKKGCVLTGLDGTIKALYLCALKEAVAAGTLVLLVPGRDAVREYRQTLAYLYPDVPVQEFYPTNLPRVTADSRNLEIQAGRAAALRMIAGEETGIVFVTAEALLQKQARPSGLSRSSLQITAGETLEQGMFMERLAEKTLGDPDAYNESTPLDILKDAREEGRKEGIEESTKKHKIELAVQKEEQDKIIAAARENNRNLVNELLNTVHIALQEKEKAHAVCLDRLKVARIFRLFLRVFIALIYCGLVGALVYGIVRLAIISQSKPINYLDIALAIWPVLVQAVFSLISWFTVKEFKPWGILNSLVENCYELLCKKLKCSEAEIQILNDEIDQLNARKAKLEHETEKQLATVA